MNSHPTPVLRVHQQASGMDNVRCARWLKSSVFGAAVLSALHCSFAEPVWADVVVTPTTLTMGILQGQTTASGSITARNTGVTAVKITWSDAMPCLETPSKSTRRLGAGESTTFTIQAICPATGSATLSGSGVPTVTIPVSVTTAPEVGVNPTSLVYAGTVGGTSSVQTVSISNAGGGTLTWSTSSNVTWLTLSPQSGTSAATVSATVNPAGLLLTGTYNAAITVTAQGASSKTIPVTLNLAPASTSTSSFSVSPPSLAFTATVGGPSTTGTVTVNNTGTSTVTVTWYDQINWLAAASADTVTIAPGMSATVSLAASAAGLTAGSYSGTATVSGGGMTKQIPVSLTAVASAVTSVGLAWDANTESDLSGYKLYLRTSSETNYGEPIATLPTSTTTYTVTGLQPGTTYIFDVTAVDFSGNESAHSNQLTKTIY